MYCNLRAATNNTHNFFFWYSELLIIKILKWGRKYSDTLLVEMPHSEITVKVMHSKKRTLTMPACKYVHWKCYWSLLLLSLLAAKWHPLIAIYMGQTSQSFFCVKWQLKDSWMKFFGGEKKAGTIQITSLFTVKFRQRFLDEWRQHKEEVWYY